MRMLSWFLSISLVFFASASVADPAAQGPGRNFTAIPFTLASVPADTRIAREAPLISDRFGRVLPPAIPAEKPIQLAGRCGSSNVYCSNPTPYCCGTGPGNYYCAKNVNGCTR